MCASESCSLRPSVFVFLYLLFVFFDFFLKDGYDLGVLMLLEEKKIKMLSEFFDIISISSTSGVITVIVSLG